jgi:peptidoglycan/LPS O-acetylase OafA/YrhL
LILKHIPLFGAGLMLYCLHIGRGERWRNYLMWLVCMLVGVATTPDFSIAVALAGTVAMRGIAVLKMRWLANPVLVFLGAVSYPLYLLHENIGFVFMRALYAQGASTPVAIGLTLVLILALAAVVAHVVERPAMRFIRQRYRASQAPEALRRTAG